MQASTPDYLQQQKGEKKEKRKTILRIKKKSARMARNVSLEEGNWTATEKKEKRKEILIANQPASQQLQTGYKADM